MEAMEGTVSPKSHINGFHGEQTHSIPEPVHLKGEMACEMEKRSSQIGDYLDFVMWIRSLLLRMYPSLSQLKEDMPLISGLKWPERHAWGRQVDEECPSHWRRFRLKEAKRLASLSKRCFDIMLSIGRKIVRGEMKRSTISKEAGSTTFDFLAKKSEGEMFHVLSLIQSNELYIRDANAMVRSQRGRRTQANEEEYLEDSGLCMNQEAASMASPCKRSRKPTESTNGSAASPSGELPTMVFGEDSRSEDTALPTEGFEYTHRKSTSENSRLTRVVESLKDDLKEARDELLKTQEKLQDLEEENEVLSSLLSDHRVFQQQQQEIHNRRMKLKDEIIQRLKRDLERLTSPGTETEKNELTSAANNRDGPDVLVAEQSRNENEVDEHTKNVKVGDFVLCHNSSENFYMGQVLDIPNQSEVLCVEYRDNKNDSDQNPSNKKITSISRDCIFRWGNFEDVRSSCMGEDF